MLLISKGSDPGYPTKAVGQGAEHYYLRSIDEAGEPPGIWLGAAAGELGLTGEVDAAVMTNLYTDFIDPRKRDAMHAQLDAITAEKGSSHAGLWPIGHSQESMPDTTWRGEAVVSQSTENQNFPHPVNDFGGLPAGPMVFTEHELSPWEKRCHATLECLYWREVMSQEEKRRTIEDLGQTLYAGLGYYQKWALSVATCLMNKGLLTQDELAAKTDEVRARLEAEARS